VQGLSQNLFFERKALPKEKLEEEGHGEGVQGLSQDSGNWKDGMHLRVKLDEQGLERVRGDS
jgi:hypothetical protein